LRMPLPQNPKMLPKRHVFQEQVKARAEDARNIQERRNPCWHQFFSCEY
jgi:hypothetical protein